MWLRRILPLAVTGAVVTFLLLRYPISEIQAEMAKGNFAGMIPFAAIAVVGSLVLIASADFAVFRSSLRRVRWWDVLVGKAGTSVLMAIGYGPGHAAYGVWVARKTRNNVRTTVGLIAFISMSDLTALCYVATIAGLAAYDLLDARARIGLTIVAPSIAIGMTLTCLLGPKVLHNRVRNPQFLRPWTTVSIGAFFLSILLRGVNLTIAVATTWAAATAFGLPIPLSAFATFLPIIFFIGALPINVLGFGAIQLVWVKFFEPWAPGEQILACQFLLHLIVLVFLVARAAPFLPRVSREIAANPADDAEAVKSSATADSDPEPDPAAVSESTAT